jgi:hypothetical protein
MASLPGDGPSVFIASSEILERSSRFRMHSSIMIGRRGPDARMRIRA